MIFGKRHPYNKHPALASGYIETDRNAVVMVEPFAQFAHGIGKLPAFELHLNLAHNRLASRTIQPIASSLLTSKRPGSWQKVRLGRGSVKEDRGQYPDESTGPCPAGRRGVAELTCRNGAYRYTGKGKVKADGTAGTRTQCVIFLAHSIDRPGVGRVGTRPITALPI
jgi:hypothetical protein